MEFASKQEIEKIKSIYKEGLRIKCIKMNDIHSVPPGSLGTITGVDDIGTVFVKWDCGSSLGLVYKEDEYELVKEKWYEL